MMAPSSEAERPSYIREAEISKFSGPTKFNIRGVAQSGQSSRLGRGRPQVQILLRRPILKNGRMVIMRKKMNDKTIKKRSKLLSLILRHRPELAGLRLGDGGWVEIDDLLAGLFAMKRRMTREQLIEAVGSNDKKRFSISEDGKYIRAAQGHTVKIDLGLAPLEPPHILFHGTAHRSLDAIAKQGLLPMWRDHVHLSLDIETATKVGMRHGKPVILKVDARGLQASGQNFYQADNGVWLTGPIAPEWFDVMNG